MTTHINFPKDMPSVLVRRPPPPPPGDRWSMSQFCLLVATVTAKGIEKRSGVSSTCAIPPLKSKACYGEKAVSITPQRIKWKVLLIYIKIHYARFRSIKAKFVAKSSLRRVPRLNCFLCILYFNSFTLGSFQAAIMLHIKIHITAATPGFLK